MRNWLIVITVALANAAAGSSAAVRENGQSAARAAVVESRDTLKIVAFGDSLTSGHRLPKSESYPSVLERELRDAGIRSEIVNHGVNGDTSAGGVGRLDDVLAEDPDILIVAFGANDGLRGVPVPRVRANLSTIIETAQARGIKVLLVGMEALPLYGWQYTIDFHHLFPELAARYNVPLVPFMLNGVLGNPDLMARDGIHPNAAGARIIAANVLAELRPLAQSLVAATN